MNIKWITTIFLLCFGSLSWADMVLNNSILYFEPGKPNQQDVEVENVGDKPLYIKVTPKRVLHPGTEQQVREPYDDPKKAGLLVSPNKMIVPPGGRKLLRFVNLNPNPTEEHVYRVGITPVVGELEAKQSGVKIVIGYEVLVLVHPVDGKIDLVHKREGKLLKVENRGNRNVLLREGVQCEAGVTDESLCEHFPGKRLYPGNSWSFDLPKDNPVKFYLSQGTQNSIKIFE